MIKIVHDVLRFAAQSHIPSHLYLHVIISYLPATAVLPVRDQFHAPSS